MLPARCETFATAGEEAVNRLLKKASRPRRAASALARPDIGNREPGFVLLSPGCGLAVLDPKAWTTSQIPERSPKEAVLRLGGRRARHKPPLVQARKHVNSFLHLLARQDLDAYCDAPWPLGSAIYTWAGQKRWLTPSGRRRALSACSQTPSATSTPQHQA